MSEISFDQSGNANSSEKSIFGSNLMKGESDIDLMHYYRLLLRNLWKIGLFSFVIGCFTVLFALSLPPVYDANTTLLIENQQPNLFAFKDVYQVDTRNRNYLGTQLQILKSRALATRVVDRMQLTKHPFYDFGSHEDLEQSGDQAGGLSLKKILGFFRPSTSTNDSEDESVEIVDGLSVDSDSLSSQEFTADGNSGIEYDNPSQPDVNLGGNELDVNADSFSQEKDVPGAVTTNNPDVITREEKREAAIKKRVVEVVMRSLVVFPMGGTQLVNIQFSAGDPQLAADIANAFADVYIESHLEAKLEVTQKATAWLSERLGDLRYNLRESEQALQAFREREKLVDTGDVRSIDVAELEQLTQNLVESTRAKADAGALYRQISGGNLPLDRALALPIVSNNAVIQSLIESRASAKRLVAELSKRYGKKHPKMLSAFSDVSEVESELRVQVSNVARGLEVNFVAAKESEQALKKQISLVKQRLQGVNRKEFSLRELEREVEANRQVYEAFLNRGKETSESGSLESVNARVIDAAIPADYASKPEKKKIVLAAILLSGIFAAGIVLLLDWLDNTIKTPDDVEERLHVPLLGHLPLDKENSEASPLMGFLSDEKWNFAEAVRTIRTSFILSGLDKPAKVTVVTSSVPNEGKSTVSLCLAQALGQMEKVLLLDADMRRPSIGKALDISLLTPGLSNLIAGTAELEECVTRLPNTEVDVVTAGVVLGNPLDQIAGDRFHGVIEMLRTKYDRIIIDTAPIQAVSDSIVVATHADALIYVVKSDGSPTPVIKRGLRRLSDTSARFAGVVLNQVDIEKAKQVAGYEEGYYENYGYTGPESS